MCSYRLVVNSMPFIPTHIQYNPDSNGWKVNSGPVYNQHLIRLVGLLTLSLRGLKIKYPKGTHTRTQNVMWSSSKKLNPKLWIYKKFSKAWLSLNRWICDATITSVNSTISNVKYCLYYTLLQSYVDSYLTTYDTNNAIETIFRF